MPCRKGLIIHTAAVGDCALALPLARFLKTACRLDQIQFWTKPQIAALFEGRTVVDAAVSADRLALYRLFCGHREFTAQPDEKLIAALADFEHIVSFVADAESDFQRNLYWAAYASNPTQITALPTRPPRDIPPRPMSLYLIEEFARQNHIATPPPALETVWIAPLPEDFDRAKHLLDGIGARLDDNLAILHPGSGGAAKCWHIDHFIAIADWLRWRQFTPIFMLGPAELERFDGITVAQLGKVAPVLTPKSLLDAFAALTGTDLYIGNDSGISHIAGATGKPTFVVFGPTDPAVWRPNGAQVSVYQPPLESFSSFIPKCAERFTEQIAAALL